MTAVACTVCEIHAESTFLIEGMDCREEVAMIERRFKNLPGLERFSADLMGQRLHVAYDAAKLSTASISAAVADAGMRAWLEHEEPIAVINGGWGLRAILLPLSGAALILGLAAGLLDAPHIVGELLFAVSVAAGVPLTARKAWHSLRLGALDINVLMLVAAAGAVALGQWSEAAAVVFLFATAQALEARTLEHARHAVRALMNLTPPDALVLDSGTERRLPVDSILPGMVIVVKAGEKVPLDGDVISGASAVNQAPITGESLPIDKHSGDELFAGSINGRGTLEMRVTKLRRDTTLARIIHLVERAQAQRAPAQAFVERFARVYTPVVIALAVALAAVPPLAFGAPWPIWFYRSLVLLVVSCPCALVISTPVSIVAALAGAARKGVLIKGGTHLERASAIRCVAFDKTGTLTRGTPEVVDVTALDAESLSTVIGLAAAVEQRSEHPIADAVVRYANDASIAVPLASDVQSLTGLGVEGRVHGALILLGNHRLFEERGLCSPDIDRRLEDIGNLGRTAILVARDLRVIGIISVADQPRSDSAATIDLLRQHGVSSVVMLTGDSQATARAVAAELGIEEFRAELMPEDKVTAIKALQKRFGAVAMVGDGINDAPALATADVGIVMGAAGSDAALETADIALMADELMKVPYALRLSRATMGNIKMNLAIALGLKLAFVVAAITGVATLWMAVAADTGASLIVVANALRLLRAD